MGGTGPATFGYDANGNLTSDGSVAFAYDSENRLTGASGAKSASLVWDPLGRLFETSGGSEHPEIGAAKWERRQPAPTKKRPPRGWRGGQGSGRSAPGEGR